MTVTARRSGPSSPGPRAPARSSSVLVDYWAKRGMVSEPIPFDGRSDYVGFVNRGIPAGGVFAGAEAPKTAAAGRPVRRRPGRAARPLLPRGVRYLRDGHRPAAGRDDERLRADPTPANLAIAQQQADSLNGNALRSLEQFKGTLVHAVWYFARVKDAFPSKATAAKAKKAERSHRFKYQGHQRARTR